MNKGNKERNEQGEKGKKESNIGIEVEREMKRTLKEWDKEKKIRWALKNR